MASPWAGGVRACVPACSHPRVVFFFSAFAPGALNAAPCSRCRGTEVFSGSRWRPSPSRPSLVGCRSAMATRGFQAFFAPAAETSVLPAHQRSPPCGSPCARAQSACASAPSAPSSPSSVLLCACGPPLSGHGVRLRRHGESRPRSARCPEPRLSSAAGPERWCARRGPLCSRCARRRCHVHEKPGPGCGAPGRLQRNPAATVCWEVYRALSLSRWCREQRVRQ